MIFHFLYISELSPLQSTEMNIQELVQISEKKNSEKDITGILMFNGKHFIQLLEGKEEVVNLVYKKISKDPRHTKVRILITYKDSVRIFPKWNMGLVSEEKARIELKEFIPLLHSDILKLEGTKERVISVLKKFNVN